MAQHSRYDKGKQYICKFLVGLLGNSSYNSCLYKIHVSLLRNLVSDQNLLAGKY